MTIYQCPACHMDGTEPFCELCQTVCYEVRYDEFE